MNKNTEKALEFAVKKLVKSLEKTTDFALEHAPDVLKEMVTEAKIEAAFAISISSAILIACLTSMYYLLPRALASMDNFGSGMLSFFSGIGAIVCIVIISCSAYSLVVLSKCPKLFLLKQLKELASPSKE